MAENEKSQMDVIADLGAMASEIGYAVQFKVAAALIATIPPDFFVAQNSYMRALCEEADAETVEKLSCIMKVYSLAIPLSMEYRRVMRAEEQLVRKEMENAKEKQGSEGERSHRAGDEGEEKGEEDKPEEEAPEAQGEDSAEEEESPKGA